MKHAARLCAPLKSGFERIKKSLVFKTAETKLAADRLDTGMCKMLDRPNLNNRIAEMAREALSESRPSTIGLDEDLRSMGLTSMGMVKLMMAVEVAFNISVPDDDLHPDNFRSVRAIEALVARLAA